MDVSFTIEKSLALVGESGSGKSLTLKSIIDMLPPNLNSKIDLDSPFELKRGDSVAFVPQNPFTALSPMTKNLSSGLETERWQKLYLRRLVSGGSYFFVIHLN